jgi:hypothetical protein
MGTTILKFPANVSMTDKVGQLMELNAKNGIVSTPLRLLSLTNRAGFERPIRSHLHLVFTDIFGVLRRDRLMTWC